VNDAWVDLKLGSAAVIDTGGANDGGDNNIIECE
jgi:hypothetical protein